MSDPHWEQIKDVFQAALEKPPSERKRFLREACGADECLRNEVLALLDSFEEADDFMDAPPIGVVAEEIVGTAESLAAGQQIGRYRIERKLGAGGMGEVFLARDDELERPVALKILSAAFSGNPDRIRRFVQEAKAVSALNHPNILTIYEIGQFENWRFIATEYIEGETLRDRIRRQALDLNEILDIFGQTAAALEAAHRTGIVHRDIKPENIMLRHDGLVKVLDFGLAKLVEKESATVDSKILRKGQFNTTPGLVMGTVAYMSPEQARGLETDARTDVWSLGVCLYETLFGVQPFAGDTVSDQIAGILKNEVHLQSEIAPLELQRIVEKCLEKNAEERYQTIEDFSRDIRNLNKELTFSAERGLSFTEFEKQKAVGERQSNGKSIDGRTVFSTQNKIQPPASSAEYVVSEIRKHKFLSFGSSVAVVVVLGLILYSSFFTEVPPAKPINSLAVLPFANDGSDADGEYLSDGLSESLINELSQLPQLKVTARSSAFKYKGKAIDPSEVARALGVQAIVTGRVARRGDDLQISVELIDAENDRQIWGESYRRKIADAQAIQEEIAQTVLRKLRLKLSGNEERHLAGAITNDSRAYQLYLNGIFYRRKNGTENLKKAIEYQNQAIALDPDFALAYAELGVNHYNLVSIGAVEPQTGTALARTAIEKALAINESLAEAHTINAILKELEFDWAGAENEVRRAIELNPNLAGAHSVYAGHLLRMGRFDEALREIKKAQELDPLRTGLIGNEGIILFCARRYDEALVKFERDDPDAATTPFPHIVLARAYAAKKRYADAIAALRKSLDIEVTTSGLIHLGRAYSLAGDRNQALAVLEQLKKTDKYVSPAESAILYDALGDREKAFAALEQAFAERDFQLAALKTDPEYDNLRDDPRFQELLRRINLSQ
ncbi:MAG: protein kinase [Acidobacteriota bacterium]|nr:protein kinase [Acidobacteriota bacterium]